MHSLSLGCSFRRIGRIATSIWMVWLSASTFGQSEQTQSDRAQPQQPQSNQAQPEQPQSDQDRTPTLNWVPLSELTEEQRAEVPTACCGAYIPSFTQPPAALDGQSSDDVFISSDRYFGPLNLLTYEGNVTLIQGSQQIHAHKIVADEEKQTADIVGPITISEPDAFFTGDHTFINRDAGIATIDNSQFVLYQSRLRGSAERIERDENEVMRLQGGEFTQCEPGNETWLIKGSEIKIDPVNQQGTVKNMRLEVGGVPLVYIPYWTFPTGGKRQSGLLYPTLSDKEFALPYYFNLAPNYDLTLTPRYIVERGSVLETEGRYLNRWFDVALGGSFLPNGKDDISDNERSAIAAGDLTEVQATEFDNEDRWLISVQHQGGSVSDGPRQAADLFGQDLPRWSSNIDYTKVSDYAYFRHVNTTNLSINRQSHLQQRGNIGYQFNNWELDLSAQAYQSIAFNGQEPYRQAPRIDLVGEYLLSNTGVEVNLNNELIQFTHADRFFNDNPADPRITGRRFRAEYDIAWDKQWLWGFFKSSAALKTIQYQLDSETLLATADDQPGVAAPQAFIDTGIFFERNGSWLGSDYLQTFEPRLFYFYSDFEDQSDFFSISPTGRDINFDTAELTFSYNQLFRDSRFAGGDRIEDARQISIGLTTRFLDTQSGLERFRLSLGQIYFHRDKYINLIDQNLDDLRANDPNNKALQSRSAIAGQIGAQLTDSLHLTGDLLYDPALNQWDQRGVNLRYYDDQQRIVNLGYRYQRNPASTLQNNRDIDQAEFSFVLPIRGNWNVIGHTYHDFTVDEALDSVLGVEYTDCCYRVRVVGRRWFDNELIELVNDSNLDHERGIFIEFQLRGLGSVVDTVGKILRESIVNFERREEAIR